MVKIAVGIAMQPSILISDTRAAPLLPSLALAVVGLGALAWLMLTAPETVQNNIGQSGQISRTAPVQSAQIGVVIAPWAQGGMRAAAAFGLPIVTIRWGGHLVVLDVTDQPQARDMLRDLGYFIITTTTPSSCFI